MGRVFKARNAVSGGYTQTANVYILGVGESSTGKSASIRALFSNLERRVLREISQYEKELEIFKKSKTKLAQDKLNGKEGFGFDDETADAPKLSKNPDFIVKNATSKAMIKAMEESDGEIFSVCEEARDSIYIVAGNYRKQGDDTETLNSGWCGEPIKHSRIVNGVFNVPNPCISLLWMVQNDIIDNIVAKNKGSFIGSGFLGRFLYCKGAPKTVPNAKEIIPLDESAIAKWEKLLNDGFYKKISFFDQYSSLRSERVEFIVHTFPELYEILKKGKGRYVVLKEKLPEAKQALGIEPDDDMPF